LIKPEIEAELLPSKILEHKNISFIPKAKPYPTRTVGSWVGICSGGSLVIANRWVQWLMSEAAPMKEDQKPLHNWGKLDIGLHLGIVEQDSYANQTDAHCPVCQEYKENKQSTEKEKKEIKSETKKEEKIPEKQEVLTEAPKIEKKEVAEKRNKIRN